MSKRLPKALFAASLMLFATFLCGAGSTVVPKSSVRNVTVKYKVSNQSYKKRIQCYRTTPGIAKSVTGGLRFTSFAKIISDLKAKRASSRDVETNKQLNSAGKKACASSTPAPTPTPEQGNFDGAGNLTAKGKIAFGVPDNLSGNITAGGAISRSYCTCHEERLGREFYSVRSAITQPPMSFTTGEISDQTLADLIAYLNRFDAN